jgi:hypothetical protein
MIVPSQLALKTHTNFVCAESLATLHKLGDRFPLSPVAPPIGDTSITHVMRLAAHSTTSPTLAAIYNDPVQLRTFFYSTIFNTATSLLVFSQRSDVTLLTTKWQVMRVKINGKEKLNLKYRTIV